MRANDAFRLAPQRRRTVQAAIALGDWLAAHQTTTREQRHAIRSLQTALRWLPEDSPDVFNAEYGFTVIPADLGAGVFHGWTISLSRHALGEPGILEVFNTWTTQPHGDLFEDAAHESSFYLRTGEANPYEDTWLELREELAHPLAHVTLRTLFEVQAELLDPAEWSR